MEHCISARISIVFRGTPRARSVKPCVHLPTQLSHWSKTRHCPHRDARPAGIPDLAVVLARQCTRECQQGRGVSRFAISQLRLLQYTHATFVPVPRRARPLRYYCVCHHRQSLVSRHLETIVRGPPDSLRGQVGRWRGTVTHEASFRRTIERQNRARR